MGNICCGGEASPAKRGGNGDALVDDDGAIKSHILKSYRLEAKSRSVRRRQRRQSSSNSCGENGATSLDVQSRVEVESYLLEAKHKCGWRYRMPILHDTFPNLTGSTQDTDNFDLYEYLGNSWGVIFMHPGDFTPVCTTELGSAAQLQGEFTKRNAKLCGFSCNDAQSHRDWIRDITEATGHTVTFPLFCDPDRTNSVALGILDPHNHDYVTGLPLTVRSVYVLNPDRTILLMMTYPASSGRNFDELF